MSLCSSWVIFYYLYFIVCVCWLIYWEVMEIWPPSERNVTVFSVSRTSSSFLSAFFQNNLLLVPELCYVFCVLCLFKLSCNKLASSAQTSSWCVPLFMSALLIRWLELPWLLHAVNPSAVDSVAAMLIFLYLFKPSVLWQVPPCSVVRILHFARTVYVCVPYCSHNEQQLFRDLTISGILHNVHW